MTAKTSYIENIKERFPHFESLVAAHATLLRSVASGDLSLEDARELSAILDNYRRGLELSDIEARLKALEGKRT
jgi:hypothetical protein